MLAAAPWFYFCVPSRRMWCCGMLIGASRPLSFWHSLCNGLDSRSWGYHTSLWQCITLVHPLRSRLIWMIRKKTIEEFLRKCLQTHGGEFDPSKISSKRYGSSTPWMVLDSLLNKGDLRSFVEQHPEFTYRAHGLKGMIITWADAHAQDTPSSSSGQALPAPVAGVSSSQAAGDTAPEPPKVLLPAQSFYDAEKEGATARWLAAQALMEEMD